MKKILNTINLPAKFILLGLFALGLFIFPTCLFIQSGNQAIDAKKLELTGIPVEKKMLSLINLVQRHRAESAIAIASDDPARASRVALAEEADALYSGVVTVLGDNAEAAQPLARLNKADGEWKKLQAELGNKQLSLEASLSQHASLIQTLLIANQDILDFYGLSLDSDLNTYQLIVSIFNRLPLLTETLGQIRASGTSLIASGMGASEATLSQMDFRLQNGNVALEQFSNNMDKVFTIEPALKALFASGETTAVQQAQDALALANTVFVSKTKTVTPAEYVRVFTEAINQFATLGTQSADRLSVMLSQQIDARRHAQYSLLGVLFAVALLAVWVAVMISRSITRPVEEAVNAARRVAEGDLTCPVNITGSNEMGQLLQSLQYMQQHLAGLVSDIKESALTIASSSEEIANGNGNLSARTEEQAASLAETAASMEQMASIISQNAENTHHATTMAEAATQASSLSGEAMSSVMDTMGRIRAARPKLKRSPALSTVSLSRQTFWPSMRQ